MHALVVEVGFQGGSRGGKGSPDGGLEGEVEVGTEGGAPAAGGVGDADGAATYRGALGARWCSRPALAGAAAERVALRLGPRLFLAGGSALGGESVPVGVVGVRRALSHGVVSAFSCSVAAALGGEAGESVVRKSCAESMSAGATMTSAV